MNRRDAIKGIIAAVAGVVAAPWKRLVASGDVRYRSWRSYPKEDLTHWPEAGPSWDGGDIVADLQEALLAIENLPLPPREATWDEPALDCWLQASGYSPEEAAKYKQQEVAAGRMKILRWGIK